MALPWNSLLWSTSLGGPLGDSHALKIEHDPERLAYLEARGFRIPPLWGGTEGEARPKRVTRESSRWMRIGAEFLTVVYDRPPMKSQLAEQARRELLEAEQKLTREERLEAYVEHSRLMVELHDAGKKLRDAERPKGRPQ